MENQNKSLTILVTGTNRGLGKQLVLMLLKTRPNDRFLFTTRKLPQQANKQFAQLHTTFVGDRKFTFKQLQLSSQESIQKFVAQVKQQKWQFDAIVNNAAVGDDFDFDKMPNPKQAKYLLTVNVIGTIRLTNLLLPYLKSNGRVVNVSSKLAALNYHTKQVIDEFTDPQLEEQQIYTAVAEYIALCEEGDLGKWLKNPYSTSKMLLNAWSRFVLQRKLKQGQTAIAMSPGHCLTDMGGPNAANSAQSGAKAIYDLIYLPNPSSQIFYHRGQQYEYLACGP